MGRVELRSLVSAGDYALRAGAGAGPFSHEAVFTPDQFLRSRAVMAGTSNRRFHYLGFDGNHS